MVYATIIKRKNLFKRIVYLCGCEWFYDTCFGRFWDFMADLEAVAMGQVLPLG